VPRPSVSLAVVGAAHANKRGPTRRFELAICQPGEPIQLIPEPKNPADENAIAVFSSRGIQIGYLSAERAPWIKTLMARGEEIVAIFQRQTNWGAWIRIGFDGEVPALPPEPAEAPKEASFDADPEVDFYPDEEWPD
jgi:hypothetical protein